MVDENRRQRDTMQAIPVAGETDTIDVDRGDVENSAFADNSVEEMTMWSEGDEKQGTG
jgi:hypothetical protein